MTDGINGSESDYAYMAVIINTKLRLLCAPAPFCAVNSIATALAHNGHRQWVDDAITPMFDNKGWHHYRDYHKIGFICHPIDWVDKCFTHAAYAKLGDLTCPFWGCTDPNTLRKMSALEFVDQFYLTPVDYFSDDGRLLVDEVVRLEDLSEFYERIGASYVHDKKTPIENKHYVPHTNTSLELTGKKFRREFDYYPERPIELTLVRRLTDEELN